ncbi:MAG: histidinol-phosphate transaminase [Oceanococcaceae bacterium]
MSIEDYALVGVRGMVAYETGKPVEEIARDYGVTRISKLASNENPLGCSPRVQQRLARGVDWSRYPDGAGHALKTALVAHHPGIDRGQITLGNGSNDILELLARTFLAPGRNAVASAHAFAVYGLATKACGAELREVPARPLDDPEQPCGHDLEAFAAHIDADTRLVFVANPNNPTGTWASVAAIEALLQRMPEHALLVLDEAYCEYQPSAERPPVEDWLARYPNLVVTRTFSKAYGLAALRIGYGLSSPVVADLLNRVRQPFNVNQMALLAAEEALQDTGFIAESVRVNAAGMAQWHAGLTALGLSWLPSRANFVCVNVKQPGRPLFDALLREGVIVRPVGGYGLPEFLRISIGTADENRHGLDALARVLAA